MGSRRLLFFLFRLFVVILVSAASLYMARIAWHSAQAFELNHRAHTAIELWLKHKQKPTFKAWMKYKEDTLTAIDYQPSNAAFINTMGRLYLYKGLSMQMHPAIRALNILKARKQFTKAASLRPAWVYPWLNLAIANAALGQWGDQFLHAYRLAMKQGRWEENTMPVLLELGLKSYERFNPEMQRSYKRFLSTAMRRRKQHLDWLKKNHVLYQKACRMLADEHAVKDFCLTAFSDAYK